jgi:hypothetical protein
VTIFTVRNSAGVFQHLAHVGWRLSYFIEFGVLNGDLTVRHNLSTFKVDPVAQGPPTTAKFKGIDGPLAQLKPPLANATAQAALAAAFTPSSAARRDFADHPSGAPKDFEFTLPQIRILP